MKPGTDARTMVSILAVALCGTFLTQALWIVARRFGPAEAAFADIDARTLGVGFAGSAAVACVGDEIATSLPAIVVVSTAAVCARTDQVTGLIFDVVTGSAFLLALAAAAAAHGPAGAVTGASIVGGSLLALHVLTNRRGIGLGDVKLGAVVGVGLGVAGGLTAIGAAFVVGALACLCLLASRRIGRGAEIRFAPYIFCGVVLAAGRLV
jgi:leader peptidase (prepilin peptidase)/N-methyltransferase